MNIPQRFAAEFRRALRNFKYERTADGVLFPAQRFKFGGVFAASVDHGPWQFAKNAYATECLDAMLNTFFNGNAAPVGMFMAPFTNNLAPTPSLTAATFASTQGEYTGYTQPARVAWVPNGASSGQSVSSSNAPAEFTVGASAVTVCGGGLIAGASAKGATTGTFVAGALFSVPNTLNPGSTLSMYYTLGGSPA